MEADVVIQIFWDNFASVRKQQVKVLDILKFRAFDIYLMVELSYVRVGCPIPLI